MLGEHSQIEPSPLLGIREKLVSVMEPEGLLEEEDDGQEQVEGLLCEAVLV